MVSNKRYEEQADFYDKEIERIKGDRDYYREKFYKTATDCSTRNTLVDVYKSILVKQGILGEQSIYSDGTFMFEGKIYRPVSYHIAMEPGCDTTLTVDFIRVREE